MHIKKSFVVLYLMLFTVFCSNAQLKVACVGNSITFGSGIENRDQQSYPAQLGRLLGAGWEVRNFGVSGATLLKHGDKPYWEQKDFGNAKAFNPDVVLIKLGTNDTKPQNWKFKDEYVSDYSALIKEFRDLPSRPMVFICLPAPAYGVKWGIRDSIIRADVIPMLKRVAKLNHVLIINLNKPLSNHPEWFPDLIHPNATGAGKIAEVVAATMVKRNKKIISR